MGLLKHKQEAMSLVQKFQQIKDFPCFVLFRKNLYENPVIVDIIVRTYIKYNKNIKEIYYSLFKKMRKQTLFI